MKTMTPLELKNVHGEITQCNGQFDREGSFAVTFKDQSENVVLSGPMQDNRLPSNWADIVNWSRSFGYSHTVAITSPALRTSID